MGWEIFTINWWIAIAVGIAIYSIITVVVKGITRAVIRTNERFPYSNPPNQLYVNEKNEWDTKPRNQHNVWWDLFWMELKRWK